MTDFAKLRAYLNIILETAEEDSASTISLRITPATQKAISELDKLEQKNCPNCGYPGLTDERSNQPMRRSAPEWPPATPKHLRTK